MTGIELIAAERQRQIDEEGYTPEHDREHDQHELARAGAMYALPGSFRSLSLQSNFRYTTIMSQCWPGNWPWPTRRTVGASAAKQARIRELAKAGALIAAEIDRLRYTEESNG